MGFRVGTVEALVRLVDTWGRSDQKNKKAKKVTMVHFQEGMKAVRPSIDEETMKFYERIGRDLERGIGRRKEELALGYFR